MTRRNYLYTGAIRRGSVITIGLSKLHRRYFRSYREQSFLSVLNFWVRDQVPRKVHFIYLGKGGKGLGIEVYRKIY